MPIQSLGRRFVLRYNADMSDKTNSVVGIDEVGRGPVAGPVAVGVMVIPNSFDIDEYEDVRDSKKHTEKQREKIYEYLKEKRDNKELDFIVEMVEPERIDSEGIVTAIQAALCRGLKDLNVSTTDAKLLLDGGLKAPPEFLHQETIIKGDSKERAISFAAIVAKVERDALMKKLGEKHPEYGFEKHKGYGTKAHFEAIRKHGMLPFHRRSFLRSLDTSS